MLIKSWSHILCMVYSYVWTVHVKAFQVTFNVWLIIRVNWFVVQMAENGSPVASHRLKAYKNKGMDAQEMRRRREEEGIQLRKQKREEQVG